MNLIIKSWDDLRQDHFAAQLLTEFDKILKLEGLSLPLKPYAGLFRPLYRAVFYPTWPGPVAATQAVRR